MSFGPIKSAIKCIPLLTHYVCNYTKVRSFLEHSCAILSSFKIVIIFNNTSADKITTIHPTEISGYIAQPLWSIFSNVPLSRPLYYYSTHTYIYFVANVVEGAMCSRKVQKYLSWSTCEHLLTIQLTFWPKEVVFYFLLWKRPSKKSGSQKESRIKWIFEWRIFCLRRSSSIFP